MGIFLDNLRERLNESFLITIFFTVFLYFALALILLPLASIILGLGFRLSVEEVFSIMGGKIHTEGEKFFFRSLQIINQFLTWGLCGWFMASIFSSPSKYLGLNQRPSPFVLIFLCILCILVSLPLVQAITFNDQTFALPEGLKSWEHWVSEVEENMQDLILSMLNASGWHMLMFNMVVFAVTPAICEEIFFRGFLQKQLMRLIPPYAAIGITAFIFSLVHFQFYGFFSRFFLGLLLGFFYYHSRSLWTSILAHFFFNAFSVIMIYLAYQTSSIDASIIENDFPVPVLWTFLSIIATGLCLYAYASYSQAPDNTEISYE